MGRQVASLGHIILILSQTIFGLTHSLCMPSGEAANTTFIVFGLTQPGHEPNQGEQANHYTIDAVCRKSKMTTITRQSFYLYPIWEIEGEKNQKSRNLIEPKQGMNIYWMIPCNFFLS